MNRYRNSSSVDIEIGYPVYVWLEIDFIVDTSARIERLSSCGEHLCKYTSLTIAVNVADAGATVVTTYATNRHAKFRWRIIHA